MLFLNILKNIVGKFLIIKIKMNILSGRERIIKTFRREATDRVPVCPMVFTNYIRKYYDNPEIDIAEATVSFYQELGSDIIHRNCFPFLYLFVDTAGPVNDKWCVKIEEKIESRNIIWDTTVHTPKGNLSLCCKGTPITKNEMAYAYTEFPIKQKSDLDLILEYEPKWEKKDIDLSVVTETKKLVGDKGILCPWVQGVFNFVSVYYRKYENLLMDPYLDEGFYRAIMQRGLEQNWSYLKILLENGVDSFAYSGNLAGGQAGPDFFEKYVLKYEKELISRIHNSGGYIIYHNCGNASSLFELYPETGMDCFESLAQPPEGDTDLKEAKKILGPEMALSGGIDQKDFLVKSTPQEIEEKVKEVLEIMKPGGGYFLSTVDYLGEETPMENIKAFINAGLKYGEY